MHSNIRVGHRMLPRPILDAVEIPAHMVTVVIGPVALAFNWVEREDVDVRETHEVHTQDLDAVICFALC